MLIRLVVTSGKLTAPDCLSLRVTHVKPARGTLVAMVGTRASCHPMPVLMMVAPASSTAEASAETSSHVEPLGTRSSMLSRYIRIKSGPTALRVSRMISRGKRMRFSYEPPHSSVRLLVWSTMNWLMRYPSEPIISTPS